MNLNTMKPYLQLKVATFVKEQHIMDIAKTFVLKYNTVLLLIYNWALKAQRQNSDLNLKI